MKTNNRKLKFNSKPESYCALQTCFCIGMFLYTKLTDCLFVSLLDPIRQYDHDTIFSCIFSGTLISKRQMLHLLLTVKMQLNWQPFHDRSSDSANIQLSKIHSCKTGYFMSLRKAWLGLPLNIWVTYHKKYAVFTLFNEFIQLNF